MSLAPASLLSLLNVVKGRLRRSSREQMTEVRGNCGQSRTVQAIRQDLYPYRITDNFNSLQRKSCPDGMIARREVNTELLVQRDRDVVELKARRQRPYGTINHDGVWPLIPLAVELDFADLLHLRWWKCEHASALISYVYFESRYFICVPEAFVGPQPALQTLGCFAPGRFAPGRILLRCYQPR